MHISIISYSKKLCKHDCFYLFTTDDNVSAAELLEAVTVTFLFFSCDLHTSIFLICSLQAAQAIPAGAAPGTLELVRDTLLYLTKCYIIIICNPLITNSVKCINRVEHNFGNSCCTTNANK